MLKRTFKKIRDRYFNASLHAKYLIITVILLIAIFLSGMYMCINTYHSIYKNEISAAKEDSTNTYDNLVIFEKRVLHIITLCQADKDTAALLKEMPDITINQYQQRQQELCSILYTLSDGSGSYVCHLYVDSPFLSEYEAQARVQPISTLSDKSWAQSIIEGWGHWQFLSAQTMGYKYPALIAPLRDQDNYSKLSALMRIDLNTDYFTNETQNPKSENFAYTLIQSADGDLIASSRNDVDTAVSLDGSSPDTLTGFRSYDLNYYEDTDSAYYYRCLPSSGWRIVTVIDKNKLSSQLLGPIINQFLIGFLMAIAGLLCAVPILYQTSSRIKRFYNYVCSSNESSLSVPAHLPPVYHDEIGKLIEAHNDLMDRINKLMDEQEKRERELHRLELSVLQAQIKPHFLYNTLEAISWMGKMNQGDKIDITVRNLTRFYRLCLSNGRDVLRLSEELEMVEKYFSIQEIKYEQKLELSFDVPDEISRTAMLPKLTLQPLVENALVHGILESGSKEGWVKIICREAKGNSDASWELCVIDSGDHFRNEDFMTCLHCEPESSEVWQGLGESYGLSNVERRLCLFFKRDAVMYIDDSVAGSTCIVIPLYSSTSSTGFCP